MVEDGVFPSLVKLSAIAHEGIQQDISRAYASISANAENQVGVFGAREIRSLFTLTRSSEENCARDAAISLGNLAVVAKNQTLVVALGALGPLVDLLSSPFPSCRCFSAR
ncbi:unnamed protein product [Heterosigma akashiwo]